MLWWIVDNLILVLVALACVAVCFAAAWRSYRNNKLLIGVAVPAALMLLAWVLSLFIVTDSMQLVRNVEAMRDLINDGKFEDAIGHFDNTVTVTTSAGKFTYQNSQLKAVTTSNMTRYKVKRIVVNRIEVEDVSRPNAKVTFYVGPEDLPHRGVCQMGFVLSPDGKWRANTLSVVNPVSGQDAPLLFPIAGGG